MSSTLTNLIYHVVFSTKNRFPLIHDDVQPRLYSFIGEVVKNRNGILLEAGGIEDHIHLVLKLRADLSLAEMIRAVKTNSSKWMNDCGRPFSWQSGYGAFTVSASNVARVRSYLKNQREHHRKKTFQEEYEAFLTSQLRYENDQLCA
jgi:putative transposase